MTTFQTGDEVRVYFNGRRGGATPGEVVRVGRTRLTVRVNGRNEDFYIETQHTPGPQHGYGTYFKTLEEEAEDERRTVALDTIKAHNLEPKLGRERSFTTEQLEALAEVVKSWEG